MSGVLPVEARCFLRKVGSLEHFSDDTQEQGAFEGPAARIEKADDLSFVARMKVCQQATAM